MGAETNTNIVRRVTEEPWRGDYGVIDRFVADGFVGHDPSQPEPVRGPDGLKAFIDTYRTAFRDARITVEASFADGDWVATRWTGRGIHEGALMGVAPTGKEVTVTGLSMTRVADGKIVEDWSNWDALGMLIQLGAVPEPARA